jgi:hypothetical protein
VSGRCESNLCKREREFILASVPAYPAEKLVSLAVRIGVLEDNLRVTMKRAKIDRGRLDGTAPPEKAKATPLQPLGVAASSDILGGTTGKQAIVCDDRATHEGTFMWCYQADSWRVPIIQLYW